MKDQITVPAEQISDSRKIAQAASMVMIALAITSLLGLLRQILVAKSFGAGSELDAFNSANRVSETLFNLIAGGALASAFIPTFAPLLTQKKLTQAWRLASATANLIFLIVSLICFILAIFAPQVVLYALASGFSRDQVTFDLTVSLLRLMLPTAIIFALSGLVMSILNSHQIFFIPALAPALYQLGLIFGLVFLPKYGIYGLAIGAILGALLHLGSQLPKLFQLHGNYYWTLGFKDPQVHEVIRLMLPRLFGVAVVQLNFWVNTNLASRMDEGSVSSLTFGFALMLIVQAIIAQSIATAALPTFSRQAASGEISQMRITLGNTIRWILLLSLPACLGLIILSNPLVASLYERGNFSHRDTQYVTWALCWYTVGLVGHALVEILSRAFYARHDTKTPVLVGIGAMSLNIVFSFVFVYIFNQVDWLPFGGLALANSLATTLEMVVLLVIMRRRLDGLGGNFVLLGLIQAAICSVVMAVSLLIWLNWIQVSSPLIQLISGFLLGLIVYSFTGFLIGVKEIRALSGILMKRFRQ
jgi:putative peptidoglycan lipid II flippase